jgi:hypothetical protein
MSTPLVELILFIVVMLSAALWTGFALLPNAPDMPEWMAQADDDYYRMGQ